MPTQMPERYKMGWGEFIRSIFSNETKGEEVSDLPGMWKAMVAPALLAEKGGRDFTETLQENLYRKGGHDPAGMLELAMSGMGVGGKGVGELGSGINIPFGKPRSSKVRPISAKQKAALRESGYEDFGVDTSVPQPSGKAWVVPEKWKGALGEKAPTAEFIGVQEGVGPLFNVKGGPRNNSTVSQRTLIEEGIEVPKFDLPKKFDFDSVYELIKDPNKPIGMETMDSLMKGGWMLRNEGDPGTMERMIELVPGRKMKGYLLPPGGAI